MRRFRFTCFLAGLAGLLVIGVPRPAQASDYSYARIVRLSLVGGDVQVSRPGHSGWEAALQNMPVEQGFTIGTNDGRAEIQFEDGTTAWIAENTLVQFTELALSDGGRITKLTLAQGTLSIYASLKRADSFTLATSQEQITVPKRALFRVDAFHDGDSISVLQGELQVNSAGGAKTLEKGQTLAFNARVPDKTVVRANPKSDGWDRWVSNREQSIQYGTAEALSYTNAPYSYGLADLMAYGAWNYFPGYGYGWQPGGMGNCWSPFMDGQWGFFPQIGWTWVSYEPWGWVPYHFGEWNYLPAYGWVWMPTDSSFWDPAPVDWYSMGNQIGWWPSSFSAPGDMLFAQYAGGCSGFGAAPYFGAFPQSSSGTATKVGSKTPPGGKLPVPPRLLLTTNSKQLGRGGRVRFAVVGGVRDTFRALPGPPLENGKASLFSGAALASNHGAPSQVSKVLVPTSPNLTHLQKTLASNNTGAAQIRMKMPSAPMPAAPRVMNAMQMPAALPHRPAPKRFPSGSFGSSARMGQPSPAYQPSYSSPGMSSRTSPAPAAPAPHTAPGRPH